MKRPSSVLVRGFSALEIAKNAGLVPAYYTDPQFIAWLQQPATDAAQVITALVAQVQVQVAGIVSDANSQIAQARTAALAAQAAAAVSVQQVVDAAEAKIGEFENFQDFGAVDIIATGSSQQFQTPFPELQNKNVHIYYNGLIQPPNSHSVAAGIIYFTAPVGYDVTITLG